MAWVVDTCVLLDVSMNGTPRCDSAIECLRKRADDGLCVCPVSVVELGPRFQGEYSAVVTFLASVHTSFTEDWTHGDTVRAFELWHDFQQRRKAGLIEKRPIADVLIAAFASRFQGLITSNPADFQKIMPSLRLVEP